MKSSMDVRPQNTSATAQPMTKPQNAACAPARTKAHAPRKHGIMAYLEGILSMFSPYHAKAHHVKEAPMKRIALFVIALFVLAVPVMADTVPDPQTGPLYVQAVSTGTIAASGSHTATAVVVRNATGYFAVQLTFTGTGTAKVEYLCSVDGSTYTEPTGATDILTGCTAGTYYVQFFPDFTKYIKIKVTETGAANSIAATGYFLVGVENVK